MSYYSINNSGIHSGHQEGEGFHHKDKTLEWTRTKWTIILNGPGLKPNWTNCSQLGIGLKLSILDCSSTHSNTLQVLQRTAFGPAPPNAGPDLGRLNTVRSSCSGSWTKK
jgi:hypothetical protein